MTPSVERKIGAVCLCLIGATLWTAAATKMLHIKEFWSVLETVPFLPEILLVPFSGVLIAVEVLLPFGLILSPIRRQSLLSCLALFGCFAGYALWRIGHGNMGGCGCFTGLLDLTSVQDLFLDLFLISGGSYAYRALGYSAPRPLRLHRGSI
ncbi:MAG TPA: MauE/DoxX family redox-associated membrane protein [Fimbriimonadaceae bacterium]|nr:MauE/DoxX family redox-associated membrane protein [Fimbriimonadaceae bacterium]